MAHLQALRIPGRHQPNSLGDIVDQNTGEVLPSGLTPKPAAATPVATGTDLPPPDPCEKATYLWREPGMAAVETRAGCPDYKQVFARKVPGSPVTIFTPRNTHLEASGPDFVPELRSGLYPSYGWEKIGFWGNSPLYVPAGTTLKDLPGAVRAAVAGGGEPPQPIDITSWIQSGKGGDLTTFTMKAMGAAQSVGSGKFPPSGMTVPITVSPATLAALNPAADPSGGKTSHDTSSGSGGGGTPNQGGSSDSGFGIGTVLLVAAAAAGAAYLATRKS